MNYTENYHLPQWVKEDRIMMDDFNQMCLDMENGLVRNAEAAAMETAKAAQEAARATQEVASATRAAQAAADAALAVANNAYCPENKPYAIGNYKGNGETTTITLGFRPRFVLVSGMFRTGNGDPTGFSFLGEIHSPSSAFELLADGFAVKKATRQDPDWGEVETYPFLNSDGRNYIYIAFR